MRSAAAISILAGAVLVASATTGIAALPTFSTTTVKVPKSIGGVTIGMSKAKASRQWGGKGACGIVDGTPVCQFESRKSPESGRAVFGLDMNNKVLLVAVSALPDEEHPGQAIPITKGPLLKLKTEEGLSLGDRLPKFKRLYPSAVDNGQSYVVDKRRVNMLFQFTTGKNPRLLGLGLFKGNL